ncbi:uncharacterized protein LOC143424355 [Xylocopa sonorina]|uniref:uncharacterized protein LOC143424355 n=1 Tax=Xylocopa sonorina TaxID=1818115 RepID=UPI00403B1600
MEAVDRGVSGKWRRGMIFCGRATLRWIVGSLTKSVSLPLSSAFSPRLVVFHCPYNHIRHKQRYAGHQYAGRSTTACFRNEAFPMVPFNSKLLSNDKDHDRGTVDDKIQRATERFVGPVQTYSSVTGNCITRNVKQIQRAALKALIVTTLTCRRVV